MIDKNRMIEEFSELVAIDSPSYGERQMADVLRKKLEEIGFQVTEDVTGNIIGGNCGNLYGFLPGQLTIDPLLFSGHMDTVSPANGKIAVVQSDGRITSAGNTVLGADDLTGIVSILEAIRSIREDGIPHRPIEILFTVAEELYTRGSSAFDYSNVQAKEAYVLDLTGNVGKAAYTAPSILSFKVEIKGRAAHAGFEPEAGIHAIAVAANAISRLKLGRIDEETTANIGTIAGGEATNIIPELCRLEGEVRGFRHEKAIQYLQEIKRVFEEVTNAYEAVLQWEEEVRCIAYETDREGSTAARYKEACEKEGLDTELVKTFGGSDLNAFSQNGIAGLVLANAMNKVHTCEEYTEIEEFVKSAAIVRDLILSKI